MGMWRFLAGTRLWKVRSLATGAAIYAGDARRDVSRRRGLTRWTRWDLSGRPSACTGTKDTAMRNSATRHMDACRESYPCTTYHVKNRSVGGQYANREKETGESVAAGYRGMGRGQLVASNHVLGVFL